MSFTEGSSRSAARDRAVHDSLESTDIDPDELVDVFNEINFDNPAEESTSSDDSSDNVLGAFHALSQDLSFDGSEGSAMEVDMPDWVTSGTITQRLINGTPNPVSHVPYAGMYNSYELSMNWHIQTERLPPVTPRRSARSTQPNTPVVFAHAQWDLVPAVETDEQIERVMQKIRMKDHIQRRTGPPAPSSPDIPLGAQAGCTHGRHHDPASSPEVALAGRIGGRNRNIASSPDVALRHRSRVGAAGGRMASRGGMHLRATASGSSSESELGTGEGDPDDSGDEYVPDRYTPPREPARSPSPIDRDETPEPVVPDEELFSASSLARPRTNSR